MKDSAYVLADQLEAAAKLLRQQADEIWRISKTGRREGSWDDEERAIMREVFAHGYSQELVTVAENRLQRDRQQIRAMAGNMGLGPNRRV